LESLVEFSDECNQDSQLTGVSDECNQDSQLTGVDGNQQVCIMFICKCGKVCERIKVLGRGSSRKLYDIK